ncbi:MAG: hypothetical protein HZC05_04430 [Candidatus Magasanikbacteria bacterium]|nr:hypothetical protein [Candidatus Magasanikbacteria bacterium]
MTEGRPISLEELRARFEQEQAQNNRLRSLDGMTRKGGAQAEAAEKAKRRLMSESERKGK